MHSGHLPAFTVIELLVVITIIVVLLALLTPALDKAIYQAELTDCASRLRTVSVATVQYAMASRRRYPHRPGVENPQANWQPNILYSRNETHNAAAGRALSLDDERTVLNSYMPINATLNDPLVGKLDFFDVDADATVWGAYMMWFGWQFTGPAGGAGMKKLGDRFFGRDINDTATDPAGRPDRYALLVSDRDMIHPDGVSHYQGGHPDHEGTAYELILQNGSDPTLPAWKFMQSTWRVDQGVRGNVDLNFALDDGSVDRAQDVEPVDDRMSKFIATQEGNVGNRATVAKSARR